MAPRGEHNGHVEPTVFSTAFGIWLAAIPAAWLFVHDFGFLRDTVITTAVWLPACMLGSSMMTCRNANEMSSVDYLKGLALLAIPYLALGFYAFGIYPEIQHVQRTLAP